MKQLLKRKYMDQDIFLRKCGACFWLPWITKERYVLLRVMAGVLFGFCGGYMCKRFGVTSMAFFVLIIVFATIVGYFLPMLAFKISDKRDNEQMMSDIRKLYEYVKIQVKAGMYLTNTLSACYLAISNRRLKQGLLELNSRLIATNSVSTAVTDFGEKFTNEYISYFCLIISQSEQSGRMTQMLDDMTKQIEDMQKYMMTQKRGRIERKVIFLTLLVFLGIILIAAYQLAVSLMASVVGIVG